MADLNGLVALVKGRVKGAEIWDPSVPATVDVATTIAGVEDGVVLSPEMADRHLGAWKLPILGDLRGRVTRGPLEVFLFTGADGSCTAVQCAVYPSFAHQTTLRLPLPAGGSARDLTATDFMGNPMALKMADGTLAPPLSREPIYLTCKGPNAEAALRAMYEAAKPQP